MPPEYAPAYQYRCRSMSTPPRRAMTTHTPCRYWYGTSAPGAPRNVQLERTLNPASHVHAHAKTTATHATAESASNVCPMRRMERDVTLFPRGSREAESDR